MDVDNTVLLAEFWCRDGMSVRLQNGLQRHWYAHRDTVPLVHGTPSHRRNVIEAARRATSAVEAAAWRLDLWPDSTTYQAMYDWQYARRQSRVGYRKLHTAGVSTEAYGEIFGQTAGVGFQTLQELANRFTAYNDSYQRLPLVLAQTLPPEVRVMVQEFLAIARALTDDGATSKRALILNLQQIIVGIEHLGDNRVKVLQAAADARGEDDMTERKIRRSDDVIRYSQLCTELDRHLYEHLTAYLHRGPSASSQ